MKTDGGLCASCGENDDEVVWVTDEDDGTVSVEFDSQSPDEGDDAAPVRANDGSETATETEDGADGDSSASGTESTPSGAPHAVDPFWDVTVDTSSLEAAVDDDRARVQRVDTDDGDPLDRKIDNWKAQLLDLTRRSNLVDFSVTKTKSLPFHRADPRGRRPTPRVRAALRPQVRLDGRRRDAARRGGPRRGGSRRYPKPRGDGVIAEQSPAPTETLPARAGGRRAVRRTRHAPVVRGRPQRL